MKFTALALIIGLLAFTATAQSNRDQVSEADLKNAKTLKSTFEDEDLVLTSKHVTIEFDLNKKDKLVEAVKNSKYDFLNISKSSRLQFPVFYDQESEVKDFVIRDRRGKVEKGSSAMIRDEYLKQADLFHTDYRVKFVNLQFPLPGYRRTIQTEKVFKDVKYFTSEYMADGYRIENGTIEILVPSWLELEIKEFNFDGYEIKKKEVATDNGKKITYTYANIPPRSSEANTLGPSHTYPHLLFISKAYTFENIKEPLFTSVNDVYNWYNGLVKNVEVDASVFSSKVNELTANVSSEEEKIENIFYWVQDNIRYIAFEDGIAGFQPDSPQNVYEKRYGDCKGMAILTKAMLEEAGFDARLVWIGTDHLAYDYSIPSLSVDNHMICSVKLNDKMIFLDGTEKYNKFGEYASRIESKQAMVQEGDNFVIETIPIDTKPNIDATSMVLTIEGEDMKGTTMRRYESESRVMFQNIYNSFEKGDQEEVLTNYLSGGNSNYIVTTIKPFDPETRMDNLELNYDVEVQNAVSEFDNTLYVDIDPVESATNYLFKDRKNDYLFRFNQEKDLEVTLKIPAGYKIDALPENYKFSNDLLDISILYKKIDNTIQYTKNIKFKERVVPTERFEEWNNTFEKVKETANQQLILSKQ